RGRDLAEAGGEPFRGALFDHLAVLALARRALIAAPNLAAGMSATDGAAMYSRKAATLVPVSPISFLISSAWSSVMTAPEPPRCPSSSSPRLVRFSSRPAV